MEALHEEMPFDLDFHPSSSLVVTSLITGELKMFRYGPESQHERLFAVKAHKESCRSVRFADSGKVIVSASAGCSVLASDVETGKAIARLEDAHENGIDRVVCLTATTVATSGGEGFIKVKSQSEFSEDELLSLVVMKLDEETLISRASDGVIRLVGILLNRIIQPLAEHSEYPIEALAVGLARTLEWSTVGGDELVESANDDSDGDDEMDVDMEPSSSKGSRSKKTGKGQSSSRPATDFFADL